MLHTVNKSPFEKNSLKTCLRLSGAGSHILLIEDGIYGSLKGTDIESDMLNAMQDRTVYVLEPDIKARGIAASSLIPGIEIIQYEGFVQLVAEAPRVQSWL